ncbi:unnamed protein product [Orchesella dallaii]|uniref:Ubiquitin-like domain-containing protein n=1 Tax=Orchesella dallaii TaxID=48710 RepID=A0ABP1RPB2_9HEXA
MSSSSADDYEFVTPTVEHYSKLFADTNEQIRKDAPSSSLQSLSCSTKSAITDANLCSKIESSASLSSNTSKNDENSDTSDTSEDLYDLVAEANKMIAAAPKPSPSSQKRMVEAKSAAKRKVSSRTTSKRKATSLTADHTIISPRTRAAVAAAGSAPPPKRERQLRSQSLTATTSSSSISAPVFETVTQNKRRRSTLQDKKPVPELVRLTETSSDEDEEVVEGMDIDVDLDLNQNEFVDNLCTVRIRWKDEILRFTVPEETKMSKIRMEISERISIRADNLLILGLDTREVSDYVIVKNLPIGILEVFERPPIPVTNNNRAKQVDLGIIQVKIQGCKGYRERLLVFIKKTTHVKQLVEDFVEKYGYHGKHFKLVFDGDTVDLSETPESLGLDGGEMFDIVEVK